jgi:hypothetical protein
MMAKPLKVREVQAPSSVDWWTQLGLRRQGRQDARRYKSLNDYTRTHALIVAQNKTNAGQRNVNQWVIQSVEPIRTGNARILVQLEVLAEKLERIQITSETSGRKKRELSAQEDRLEKQISNFTSQYQTNLAAAESILMQGEQAIGSWANYYEQLAGIYTRARAAKLKIDVSSVEAEVPTLESIELVEIPELSISKTHEKDLKKK